MRLNASSILGAGIRPPRALERQALALHLLVSRRPGVFAVADVLLVVGGFLNVVTGDGTGRDLWTGLIMFTTLVLGIPVMSDVIALERRSGSLDLALSSPGAATVFERRLAPALVLMVGQSWLLLVAAWLGGGRQFAIVPPLVQCVLIALLLGATTLFWAVRVKTAGAVALATAATVLMLSKWTLRPPISEELLPGIFLPPWKELRDWSVAAIVILGAAVVLYLHARRRLARPELMT